MDMKQSTSSADDHKSDDERVVVSDNALSHHHHRQEATVQEQKNGALSDNNNRKESLLFPQTIETITKTSTKKRRQSSVDLFMDRFRRQKVERGCPDGYGFNLFGCGESCKHTNNNNIVELAPPPPQMMMNMPPASTSSAQNNQERENTKTETKHHIKLIINQQKKQVSTPHLLPRVIVNDIISKGGSEIQHVGTKKLVDTDIEKHQNRLNVINPDALMNALTPQEREKVTGPRYTGLEVEMMDATGIKYSMNIRRRTHNGAAVINRQWSNLVRDKKV